MKNEWDNRIKRENKNVETKITEEKDVINNKNQEYDNLVVTAKCNLKGKPMDSMLKL